jgi:hypothetical protein
VIGRCAALVLVAGGILFSNQAQAAIFRISDSSWVANPANANESGAAYTNSGGTTISGDFHMVTKYLDSNGATVVPGDVGTVTAWNIRITGGINDTFSNASGTATYTFVSGTTNKLLFQDGTDSLEFNFNLTHPLTDNLGNSIEPSGATGADENLFRETFTSTIYNATTLTAGVAGAQVDFVPFSASLLFAFPVFNRFRKLKKL